jgi:hypothetical protein
MAKLPLLVVDGYNVIYAGAAYKRLVPAKSAATGPRAELDPMSAARDALVADVATFAQGSYEAVIVFDGARNVNPARPAMSAGGVRLLFSDTGTSADSLIERLAREAKEAGRKVTLVTSDATVRATVGDGVARISADTMSHNLAQQAHDVAQELEERSYSRMTLGERLDPATLKKLNALRGK